MDEFTYFYALPDIKKQGKIEVKHIIHLSNYHVGFGVLDPEDPYLQMQKEFNKYNQEDLAFSQVFHWFWHVIRPCLSARGNFSFTGMKISFKSKLE